MTVQIRTVATNPRDREDRRIVVWVVVTASNPTTKTASPSAASSWSKETLNKLLG